MTLIKLCIVVITEEFERFSFAFAVSKNETLKRNLEFLQRKYSSELASELLKKEKLIDEYVEFLLNEHLKIFDEKWLKFSRYRICTKEVFCRLPNLIKIYIREMNDEILKMIAKFCPKVVEIKSEFVSEVTDRGINYLCKEKKGNNCVPCPELKVLDVGYGSEVTDKGVELLLRKLKSLEKQDFRRLPLVLYSLHKEDMPVLEKIPAYNLVELDLSWRYECILLPYYSDILKVCLTLCPKLKKVSCCISDEKQLNEFKNTSLKDLSMEFFAKEQININSFLKKSGSKLVSLKVSSCIMSLSELAVSCPKLEHLMIRNVIFPDFDVDSKAVFNFLTSFSVAYTFKNPERLSESYKGISFLFLSSPKLEDVTFSYIYFPPHAKVSILKSVKNCPLKSLKIEDDSVEENFVKDILLSCPSLKTLDLSSSAFPGEEYKELAQFAETLANKPRIDTDGNLEEKLEYAAIRESRFAAIHKREIKRKQSETLKIISVWKTN